MSDSGRKRKKVERGPSFYYLRSNFFEEIKLELHLKGEIRRKRAHKKIEKNVGKNDVNVTVRKK